MRVLTPAEVLFNGDVPPAILPACDHYAGSEKLMLKSLALQQQLGPVFDVTLDCEDGAQVGHEAEHAELVASLTGSEHGPVRSRRREDSRLPSRALARRHPHHPARRATRAGLYHTAENPQRRRGRRMCAFIDATRRESGIAQPVPVQILVETHGALADVFALAALPGVEALSFGLMDFVSAHNGAIADRAMRSPGQFDHPLVRRAKLEIAAACHAYGKIPSHNVTTEVRDMGVVANDAARARDEFGYTRMWSIHPAQIPAIVRRIRAARRRNRQRDRDSAGGPVCPMGSDASPRYAARPRELPVLLVGAAPRARDRSHHP